MATTMPGKEVEIEVKVDPKTVGEAVEELAEKIAKIKRATEIAARSMAEGMKDAGAAYKGYGELEELGKIMAETRPKAIALGEAMKEKEIAAGVGEWAKGLTSLDPVLEDEPVMVGTVVYYMEEGWRQVPLTVVEIIRTAEPTIVVRASYGWAIRGRWDELHEAYIKEIPLRKLTRFLKEHERTKTALDT